MRGRLALVGAGATGTSISVSMMFTRYSYSVLLVVLGRGFCNSNSKGGHSLMCFGSASWRRFVAGPGQRLAWVV